jgi:probable rRNA maturation factor
MITIEPPSLAAASGGEYTHRKSNGIPLDKPSLRRFLLRAQTAVGLVGEVHVLLSDDAALRRLNLLFRAVDKATDVLSFPAANPASGMAGDLAISLEHAQRQAEAFGHTLAEEVRILLLHGLLHLAGEDHETDTGQMAARERTLRAKLRLPLGLIERVEHVSVVRAPVDRAKAKPVSRVTDTQAVHNQRVNLQGATVHRRRA